MFSDDDEDEGFKIFEKICKVVGEILEKIFFFIDYILNDDHIKITSIIFGILTVIFTILICKKNIGAGMLYLLASGLFAEAINYLRNLD